MNKWGPLAVLLLLSMLLMFVGLGNLGLTDRDEGSNAEAAREMVESGNWVTPTLNGEPRFAKPVFVYWLMSTAYRLFGVNEFAARFPSAFFGVALVFLQHAFLTQVRGSMIALLGALMLLLNIEIVAIGRLALTDSVLIFFTTLSLFGCWLGLHGQGWQRHCIWLFYVGMAIGTLTKGPIGVAVPLLGVIPYLTFTGRWRQFWQSGFPLAGSMLFILLAVPWYAGMLAIHGSRYTASAQADTVGRFLNVTGGHGGTILLYIPVLLFGFFPWSGFLPMALYQALQGWREARGMRHEARFNTMPGQRPHVARPPAPYELELFAGLWTVTVFLFFSLSATRLPHYIGPLFPAAAILVASYWSRCLTNPSTSGIHVSLRTLMATGYALGLALVASPWIYSTFIEKISKEFPMAAQVDPGIGPQAAGIVLLVGMGLVGYFGLSADRRPGAFWAAGATIVLVLLIAIQITLPRFSRYFIDPPQELAYAAGLNLQPQDRLILYGPPKPSLFFYARRPAIVIRPGEEDEMRPKLKLPGRTMILLPSRLNPQLPPEAKDFSLLLQRYGYSLLANEPMIQSPTTPASPGIGPHGLRR